MSVFLNLHGGQKAFEAFADNLPWVNAEHCLLYNGPLCNYLAVSVSCMEQLECYFLASCLCGFGTTYKANRKIFFFSSEKINMFLCSSSCRVLFRTAL